MALSDYWRLRHSWIKSIEMAQLLQNAQSFAEALGGQDVRVQWRDTDGAISSFSEDRNLGATVSLDAGPLLDTESPVPGERLDVTMGVLAHEVGHQLAKSIKVGDLYRHGAWSSSRSLEAEIQQLDNILEDYYVDRLVASKSGLHGRYIAAARRYYNKPKVSGRAAMMLADSRLDPASRLMLTLGILGATLIYGHDLPSSLPDDVAEALLDALKVITDARMSKIRSAPKRASVYLAVWRALEPLGLNAPPPPPPSQPEAGADDEDSDSDSGDDDDGDGSSSSSSSSSSEDKGEDDDSDGSDDDTESSEPPSLSPPSSVVDTLLPDMESRKANLPPKLLAEVTESVERNTTDMTEQVIQALWPNASGAGPGADIVVTQDGRYDPVAEARAVNVSQRLAERLSRMFRRFRVSGLRKVRGVTRGRVSPPRLWRAGMARDDIFERRDTLSDFGADVVLLLDISASISESDLEGVVFPLAAAFIRGIDDHRRNRLWVLAYTTTVGLKATVVTVISKPEWGHRLRLAVGERYGTPSGPALVVAGDVLRHGGRRESKKIVVHVTDGRPSSTAYSPYSHNSILPSPEESVKKAVAHLGTQDIDVAALLVGRGALMLAPDIDAMYSVWEKSESLNQMPAAMERLLAKLLA